MGSFGPSIAWKADLMSLKCGVALMWWIWFPHPYVPAYSLINGCKLLISGSWSCKLDHIYREKMLLLIGKQIWDMIFSIGLHIFDSTPSSLLDYFSCSGF